MELKIHFMNNASHGDMMNFRKALNGVAQLDRYTIRLYEHKCEDMLKYNATITKATRLKCFGLNVTFKPHSVILGKYEPDLPLHLLHHPTIFYGDAVAAHHLALMVVIPWTEDHTYKTNKCKRSPKPTQNEQENGKNWKPNKCKRSSKTMAQPSYLCPKFKINNKK